MKRALFALVNVMYGAFVVVEVGVALALAGCPDPNAPGAGGPGGPAELTTRLGDPVDELACAVDEDCAVGFACVGARCAAIDGDGDDDGYDGAVDCDDTDAARNPGAAEVCDAIDQDCDGAADEGVLNACGACGSVPVEVCNLLDDDCDGNADEECVAGAVGEIEPNDGSVECQAIALPPLEGDEGTITIDGAFDPPGDVDSFCFFVRAGTEIAFDVDSATLGAPTDGVLTLFSELDGAQLPGGFNDYSDGPDPALQYVFAEDGNVRLDLHDFYVDNGGPAHVWQLRITAVQYVQCEDGDGDGLSGCDGDCLDSDALVFPSQSEVCDGADNDCDGDVDEACPSLTLGETEPNEDMVECALVTLPFVVEGVIAQDRDKDTYCFFAPSGADLGFDVDAKELGSLLNSRLTVLRSPGTTFAHELIDNDDGVDPETGYSANNSDSYIRWFTDLPGIYAIVVEDESSFAGGQNLTYTLRADVIAQPVCSDLDGDGVTTCEGDCDDTRTTVHFGALEICDGGRDNDCDGVGDSANCSGDFDGDGFPGSLGDCDDDDPLRFPGAPESCNGLDDDCDGAADDDAVTNACGTCGHAPAERCANGIDDDCDGSVDIDCDDDFDGDGLTADAGDCDDNDAAVAAGAVEVCNGIDDNCDGFVDEFVKNVCGRCGPDPAEVCDGVDNDCDGLVDDGAVNACGTCGPAPLETCDGLDNDCNGAVDENVTNACGLCGALPAEVCDGLDNDCDGAVDGGCDADGDGDGVTRAEGDCDDGAGAILPVMFGGIDACGDGVDGDCDGRPDDGCAPRAESETNNTIATCDALLWPARNAGTVSSTSDADFWCFTIDVPGTVLGFDIDARDDGSPLDAVVELFSPAGVEVAENNTNVDPDTGLSTVDPYLSFTFDTAGTWAIKVRAAGTGASAGANAAYVVDVRAEGGCLDLDRDGFTTCGANADCDDFASTTRPGATDVCDGVDNDCTQGADQLCVGSCLDDTLEQNDTPAQASAQPLAAGVYPALQACGGDTDFYAIEVAQGESLRVDALFDSASINLGLELLDTDGDVVATSNAPTGNESVSLTPSAPGTFFARVFGPFNNSGAYELRVTLVTE